MSGRSQDQTQFRADVIALRTSITSVSVDSGDVSVIGPRNWV
jgi:hypothetical protein